MLAATGRREPQHPPCVAENGPLLRDSEVQAVLGSNVLPVFRLLHAQVAAAAAVLSHNIRTATGHIPVCCPPAPPLPPALLPDPTRTPPQPQPQLQKDLTGWLQAGVFIANVNNTAPAVATQTGVMVSAGGGIVGFHVCIG